jgi:hypothetical protein
MTGMPRDFGLAVAAGLLSAVLFLAVLSGNFSGMVASYLAPLPLWAAGLGLGPVAAAVAAMAGMVGLGVVTGGVNLPFGVAVALPAVVLARQALLWRSRPDGSVEWYPPGLVLGWLFAAAGAGTMIAGLVFAGESGGFPGAVESLVRQMLEALGDTLGPNERSHLTAMFVPYLPAMVGASWVLMTALNGVLAQGGLVRLGRNRRPSPAYATLVLPDWVAWGVLVGAVVAMLADGSLGYAARNAAVLLLLGYVFPGLAWIHGTLRARGGRSWLVMFYSVFVVGFGWAVMVVAAVGLIRHWMTLGRRWSSPGQEEK